MDNLDKMLEVETMPVGRLIVWVELDFYPAAVILMIRTSFVLLTGHLSSLLWSSSCGGSIRGWPAASLGYWTI